MLKFISSTVLITLSCFLNEARAQLPYEIPKSHIEGNVPPPGDFDRLMKRDLLSYFQAKIKTVKVVNYSFLRDGPTQTGIAFPKFYLWVSLFDGKKNSVNAGAVRVAAIAADHFEVTDFVDLKEIKRDPGGLGGIFPKPVIERILQEAGLKLQ